MNRNQTTKDYQERMNRVLRYIETNLDGKLSLDTVAGVACFSPFHFHRIFQAFTGETLNAYVRRVRLEFAAHHLCHSERAVTDIALSVGYETPAAFTRAFSGYFSQSPTDFRKSHATALLPRMQLVVQPRMEEKDMEPEIRDMEPMPVIYVRRMGPYKDAAEAAWGTLCGYAFPKGLEGKDSRFIGVCYDDPDVTPEDKIRYEACITVDREVQPEGEIGVQTIDGGRYAVFLHEGPYEKLKDTYQAVYGQWVPGSGCKLREKPCFEVYLNSPDETPPEDLRTEICIPIE
jgi:AraC family transcriptional regulator